MHDGISIINLTTGRRRENSSAAFGKVAVGNAFFRECIFSGMMPFVITEGQAGQWERGIPQKIIQKRQCLFSHRFRSQWITSSLLFQAILSLHIQTGRKKNEERKEEKK